MIQIPLCSLLALRLAYLSRVARYISAVGILALSLGLAHTAPAQQRITAARISRSGITHVSAPPTAHPGVAPLVTVPVTTQATQPFITADAAGNIYEIDAQSTYVLKQTLSNGSYTESALPITLPNNGYGGIDIDAAGNIYIADYYDGLLLKYTLSGGAYTQSTIGAFQFPPSISVGADGSVYSCNRPNGAYKFTPSGSTYIQSQIYSGDCTIATPDLAGNVYILNTYGQAVYKETLSSGFYVQTQLPTSALSYPMGIRIDASGDVYISDSFHSRILMETPSGSTYTESVVPYSGTNPGQIALDAKNNLYVAGYYNSSVLQKIQPAAFASSNVGTAETVVPVSFVIDTTGTLGTSLVLTQGQPNLDFTLGTGSTCTGTPAAGTSCFVNVIFKPLAPGVRAGAVQLTDANGNVIATNYISSTGNGPAVTFPGNTATALLGSGFSSPGAVAVDSAGNLYIADSFNNAVKEIVAVNGVVSSTSTVNTIGGGFSFPFGVAVDGAGNVFVADSYHNAIKEIVAVGGVTFSTSTVNTIGSGFSLPFGVAVDGAGNVYVADYSNGAVKEIVAVNGMTSSSSTVNTIGSGFSNPTGVAVDGSGNVFVVDGNVSLVKEIVAVNGVTSSSSTVNTIGSGFFYPQGVAVDAAGNVYVANAYGNSINEILAVGGVTSSSSTVVTLGSGFNHPEGVAVDGAGNIYVADTNNNAVKQLPLKLPAALSFANTAVGSTSAAQTVTLQNIGNTALTLPIPTTGQNPSLSNGFTLSNGSTCPLVYGNSSYAGTLASGATCTAVLSYTPATDGATVGSLVFTDNSLNVANSTQTVAAGGSTTSGLTVSVVSQNVPAGTGSITVDFTVGYGGNTAPTGTPTFTVNGDATNVGAISCIVKVGHNHCTATYNPSSLAPGLYTMTATQPADSTYTAATSATGALTITGSAPMTAVSPIRGVLVDSTFGTASTNVPTTAAHPSAPAHSAGQPSVLAIPAQAPIAPVLNFNLISPDNLSDNSSPDNQDKDAKQSSQTNTKQ